MVACFSTLRSPANIQRRTKSERKKKSSMPLLPPSSSSISKTPPKLINSPQLRRKMALTASTSVQVSSIGGASGTRASCITSSHANFTKERQNLNLPACRGGFKMPTLSLPSPRLTKRFRPTFVCQAQNTVAEVLEVTEGSWSKLVVESDKLVLVDFWAPWCGPCRMIAPVIDELAKEYAGKVTCYKLNTDDSPGIATQYGIRSIPTVLVFKGGEKKESVIGAVPKSTLTATLEKYLEA